MSTAAPHPEPTSVGRIDLAGEVAHASDPGPSQIVGEQGTPQVPAGYPEDGDPTRGPLAGREADSTRDLHAPGNPLRHRV